MPSSGSSSPGTVSGTVRNVVLVHGAYADGSSWSEVIERLQSAGLTATAAQNPLSSLADDIGEDHGLLAKGFPTPPANVGLVYEDGFGRLTEEAFVNDFA